MSEKEVSIETFNKKGWGRGSATRGPVADVPFTCPGDTVNAWVKRGKGRLIEVIEPSPMRTAPLCSHFADCGGCMWQHLPYEKQLKVKQGWMEKWFERVVPLPLPSPDVWQYRNKMEFTFRNPGYLGLNMSQGRGKVVTLKECHLVRPWMAEMLDSVRTWWEKMGIEAYHFNSDCGALRTLTLREGMRTGEKMMMLTVSGNPNYALNKRMLESFAKLLDGTVYIRIQRIAKGTPTHFFEMHLKGNDTIREEMTVLGEKLSFHVSPQSFFQPNTAQAEQLYNCAFEMAGLQSEMTVLDLYCGTGTLGIAAAKHVKEVIGVELSKEAVLDARRNAAENNCDNVTILQGAVGKVDVPAPDLVIIDPPREGLLPEAIEQLKTLAPPKILFISCNPAIQAENCRALGYKIAAIQPLDQFPHTPHLENIVLLDHPGG